MYVGPYKGNSVDETLFLVLVSAPFIVSDITGVLICLLAAQSNGISEESVVPGSGESPRYAKAMKHSAVVPFVLFPLVLVLLKHSEATI